MFKSIFQLFSIARKLASSGAIETVNEIYNIPFAIKLFFNLFAIGSKKKLLHNYKKHGEKLCDALEEMGTTFIKLGQFLATRPDIIGETLADDLVKLQDRLPPFELHESKRILKKEGTAVGLANGILIADDKMIYKAENLKVGLFK